MNIDKKAGHIDPKVALSQAEHEKGTVPGQQIGLYGNADKRDVRQVVKILNPRQKQYGEQRLTLCFFYYMPLSSSSPDDLLEGFVSLYPEMKLLKTKAGCYGKETSLKEA